MARSKETKIELTAYDDLFETDQSREEAKLSKIRDIPISEIDEFPDHPFKVFIDEDMEQLVDSIKRNGVMTPATVRLKEDGRYELISGHRRKKACELAGLETLKCEVKDLSRDEAIIVMVESNLQRSTILPSEKAFAYKMRLEAMKRQAGRPPKENASPLATNLPKGRSDEELGELVGESKDQIRRYIRLTELVPEILQMVDDRQIAFRPAVEISYLPEEQQYTLFRIPDGGKIRVTSAWGEKSEHTCRYIDEYHTEVGNYLYHICEFAERMEKNGATYEPILAEPQAVKAPKHKNLER